MKCKVCGRKIPYPEMTGNKDIDCNRKAKHKHRLTCSQKCISALSRNTRRANRNTSLPLLYAQPIEEDPATWPLTPNPQPAKWGIR